MSQNAQINGGATADEMISPVELCHVVLKTTPESYSNVVDFYLNFLGAKVAHRNSRITFMTYDEKDHRLAVVAIPGLKKPDPPQSSVGLSHTSFGFEKLADLVVSYEQKKAKGIVPHWCVNHGMSTSMYYTDPDGNDVETQVDNFDTAEACMAYMQSEAFAENPVGVDYDPEDFVRRVKSGEDEREIKKRPNIGPRMTRMEKGLSK